MPGDRKRKGTGVNKTFEIEAAKLNVSNSTILKLYLSCFVSVYIKIHGTAAVSVVCLLLCVSVQTVLLFKKSINFKLPRTCCIDKYIVHI